MSFPAFISTLIGIFEVFVFFYAWKCHGWNIRFEQRISHSLWRIYLAGAYSIFPIVNGIFPRSYGARIIWSEWVVSLNWKLPIAKKSITTLPKETKKRNRRAFFLHLLPKMVICIAKTTSFDGFFFEGYQHARWQNAILKYYFECCGSIWFLFFFISFFIFCFLLSISL